MTIHESEDLGDVLDLESMSSATEEFHRRLTQEIVHSWATSECIAIDIIYPKGGGFPRVFKHKEKPIQLDEDGFPFEFGQVNRHQFRRRYDPEILHEMEGLDGIQIPESR